MVVIAKLRDGVESLKFSRRAMWTVFLSVIRVAATA
jgi:hypothetical protein